jgi:hypothetical protein
MFGDPSGLAPEGEKNNKTQGLGTDYISGSVTNGYWAERNNSVYMGSFDFSGESAGQSPTGNKVASNSKTIDMYGTETQYVWMPGSGGGTGGGSGGLGMITPSGRGINSGGRTSTKVHQSSLSKSVLD